ncbi:MAG: tRNA 4-thiouridine(8) synthase ThiI [Faecalibacterium sp.]|nr:tRNA 4-thiouridine(8) synthase ThiI [Ruminococcus sp.]MCM1392565.1 tRNA 4-thiouridine(8) synthase ThiI [Ruminococcus sp.]MCM1485640.1 tRNA 4-thiouridine(8) synthase ThiI [Faecalibacterium sp.]
MRKVILVKNGELALKGLNRSTFEDILVKNLKRRLNTVGKFTFTKAQSTVIVGPENEDVDFDSAVECVSRVFGIAAFSVAGVAEKDIDSIKSATLEFLGDELRNVRTFKVCAKRSDKKFPFTSPEICREVGGWLLSKMPSLKVDVHNPDITVTVEVRDKNVFVHGNQIKGAGGMPVGTSGRAALLISGGIDSPVAGWTMAKRGVILDAIHFAAPPYTSKRAEMKVHDLASIVAKYSGRINFMVVPFTEIQEAIKDNCPEELFTVIMRRMMMKIALRLAEKDGCKALITGESLGQVASQTMDAIVCTDAIATMPVFRPLISMDKEEIIAIARKIGTFETSLLPYEDCCTVFTPKHPRTRPTLDYIEKSEALFDFEPLIEKAINGTKYQSVD